MRTPLSPPPASPAMPQTAPFHEGALPPSRGAACLAILLASVLLGMSAATGAGLETLAQVELAPSTKEYSQQIRDNAFAEGQRKFLAEVLLAQLAKSGNRASITRTRQRIRELALRDAAKEAVDPINTVIRDVMVRQAVDAKAEPVVRVNSMLMVGELVDVDGRPWPSAVEALAKAVADASLPLEVRIAAVVGLGRHFGNVRQVPAETATIAGPAVAGLLESPPEGDPVAGRWIVARALELLPAVDAPRAAVAAAAAILADGKADLDLRVRAATALGRLAKPDAGIDAAAAVGQVRELAVAALETDLAAAEERRFARQIGSNQGSAAPMSPEETAAAAAAAAPLPDPAFGGGIFGQFGGAPPSSAGVPAVIDEDAVPSLACRRNAWRLFALANAIRPARSGPGLAALLEKDAAAKAEDLEKVLRQAALDLDAQPRETTLEQAAESLREITDRSEEPPAGRGEAAPVPAGKQPASPFDQPAESSPF